MTSGSNSPLVCGASFTREDGSQGTSSLLHGPRGATRITLRRPAETNETLRMTTPPMGKGDLVQCPHCMGVLLGRWEDHRSGCPAAFTDHACGQCERSMDEFGKRRRQSA